MSIGVTTLRPNSAARTAGNNLVAKTTPLRPQSPVAQAKTSDSFTLSASESKGDPGSAKTSTNNYDLILTEIKKAVDYFKENRRVGTELFAVLKKAGNNDEQKRAAMRATATNSLELLKKLFSSNLMPTLKTHYPTQFDTSIQEIKDAILPSLTKFVDQFAKEVRLLETSPIRPERSDSESSNEGAPAHSTPPAPTTTQRSQSSSDSSEDEKTPPNTPARPTAQPKTASATSTNTNKVLTDEDIRLLIKLKNRGYLQSLSTSYIGKMDPDENMEELASKTMDFVTKLQSYSTVINPSNSLLLAEKLIDIFDTYRKFFSYYDYASQLNGKDRQYISDNIKELEYSIEMGENLLERTSGLLSREYKQKLSETIKEFSLVVKEVNRRVFLK